MESNPIRMCELLVGLPAVTVGPACTRVLTGTSLPWET